MIRVKRDKKQEKQRQEISVICSAKWNAVAPLSLNPFATISKRRMSCVKRDFSVKQVFYHVNKIVRNKRKT